MQQKPKVTFDLLDMVYDLCLPVTLVWFDLEFDNGVDA